MGALQVLTGLGERLTAAALTLWGALLLKPCTLVTSPALAALRLTLRAAAVDLLAATLVADCFALDLCRPKCWCCFLALSCCCSLVVEVNCLAACACSCSLPLPSCCCSPPPCGCWWCLPQCCCAGGCSDALPATSALCFASGGGSSVDGVEGGGGSSSCWRGCGTCSAEPHCCCCGCALLGAWTGDCRCDSSCCGGCCCDTGPCGLCCSSLILRLDCLPLPLRRAWLLTTGLACNDTISCHAQLKQCQSKLTS